MAFVYTNGRFWPIKPTVADSQQDAWEKAIKEVEEWKKSQQSLTPEIDLPVGAQHKPTDFRANWKEQGLCPTCGTKGDFSHFQFVCPQHGPY